MKTRHPILPAILLTAVASIGFAGQAAAATGGSTAISTSQTSIPPCFDVADQSTAPGAVVLLSTCNGANTQLWYVEMIGLSTASNNYARIVRLVNSRSNLCLDLQAPSTASGVGVQQAACNGSASQKWILSKVNSSDRRYLKNGYSGLCLMSRHSDVVPQGSGLRQYACDFTEVPNPLSLWEASGF